MCQHLHINIYLIIDAFVRLMKHWGNLPRNTMCFSLLMLMGPEWIMPWPHGAGDCTRGHPKPLQCEYSSVLWLHASQAWISDFEILPCTFQSVKVQLRFFILCNSCKKEKKKDTLLKTVKCDVFVKFLKSSEYRYICILLFCFIGACKGREAAKKGRNV